MWGFADLGKEGLGELHPADFVRYCHMSQYIVPMAWVVPCSKGVTQALFSVNGLVLAHVSCCIVSKSSPFRSDSTGRDFKNRAFLAFR